jgi:hypothetical protein
MKATLLLRDKQFIPAEEALVEVVIWRLPRMLPGSSHEFKYRLALIVRGECVVRYDNEAGKGDHKHVGDREEPYEFTDLIRLQQDFRADIAAWRSK